MEADIDCSGLQYAAKFIVAGDFDKDGLTEVVVAPDATGSRGNDLWVMKFNVALQLWDHLSPVINHPMQADIDCSRLQHPAKFAIVGDFDGDEADELVVVPDAGGSKGNDFWVMKFDPISSTWRHMVPIPNHPMEADIDCSSLQFPAKLLATGNFDGDDRDELVVVPDATGSRGNDIWVMKYFGIFAPPRWIHMAPIPNHPMEADIDCSSVQYPIKLILVADFDGDQRDEVVAVPAADGSRGNDLWVMKYVGDFPQGQWQHMAPILNHPMNADIDCSGRPYPARLVIAADFDADGRAELVVIPDAPGSRGNDLWVMKYVGDFPQGQWQHMAPIPNHPMEADIDCSGRPYPAKFAVTADLDGDGRAELIVIPDAPGSRGNDLWVMKFVGDFPQGQWQHMAPISGHPMDADIDCSGLRYRAKLAAVGDFDRDGRDELVVAPAASSSRGNDLWVMKFFGEFPDGTFDHMSSHPQSPDGC